MNPLCSMSIKEAANLISAHELKPSELVEVHLDRINSTDDKLNSFVTILSESALSSSLIAEKEIWMVITKDHYMAFPFHLKTFLM